MSALDTIAGIALGGFLVTVAVKGNTPQFIALAKRDKSFLKWAVSVAFLAYLYNIPGMAEPVTLIIFIAFLALFLENGTKITQAASNFWTSLN